MEASGASEWRETRSNRVGRTITPSGWLLAMAGFLAGGKVTRHAGGAERFEPA
jgi:hypothetical protein